jgi:uncharacterized protein
MPKAIPALACLTLLAACNAGGEDPRGVARNETLLSVSATGRSEARPDKAQFEAGVQSTAGSAKAASAANAEKVQDVVAALTGLGIAQEDIQTRAVTVGRIDWGERKGQFQASNIVAVTLRDVDQAGAAVTAVTEAGANIVNGPQLSMADPEATTNLAYAEAYKAARNRAEAYAKAAGMKVSRVLYIRDAGGHQGDRWFSGAQRIGREEAAPVAAPQVQTAAPAYNPVMAGQTVSDVTIQVDFALTAS